MSSYIEAGRRARVEALGYNAASVVVGAGLEKFQSNRWRRYWWRGAALAA